MAAQCSEPFHQTSFRTSVLWRMTMKGTQMKLDTERYGRMFGGYEILTLFYNVSLLLGKSTFLPIFETLS